MLNKTAIILNLIVYLFFLFPTFIILFRKNFYSSKKTAIYYISASVLLEVALSIVLYKFSRNIFSLFTTSTDIINISVFISRIVFLDASLFPLKILLPAYNFKSNKKTVILVLSKITANIILFFLGYALLANMGILYSFPICDFIFYIIYIIIFARS